jgi:hypothetical protein
VDRVEEIRNALNAVDGEGIEYEKLRWKAAKGIWEEVQTGKSHRQLAQEITKSHVYVGWYAKCWELVMDAYDEGHLPIFADIFYSTEVRGEGFKRRKDPKRDDGRKNNKKAEDDDEEKEDPKVLGSQWIALAMTNLALLEEWTAAWEFLTEEDLATLRRIPGRARGIATQVKRSKGTVRSAKEVP